MKKKIWIILILLCVFVCMPVEAVTIKGGVTYTVEEARREAFDGVRYKIPLSEFQEHLTDPNYEENQKAIKRKKKDLGDRRIQKFSDGRYSVVYKKDRYKSYDYDSNGKLSGFDYRSSLKCPLKSYGYDTNGILTSVAYYYTLNDIYIYMVDGTFRGRYIGDKFYNANGKYVLKRIK